jgi:tRNA nucleotidyltransferase (CCA-adding enzyme)
MISGERIWGEWSKIFKDKFHREITRKLLECGCGKYMGLPENPNYEEFDRVCLNAEKNNIKLSPISYVTALLNTEIEVIDLKMRLKLTNREKLLSLSIVEYRQNKLDENTLKYYQKLVMKSIFPMKDVKECVCEFFRYNDELDLAEKFEKWDKKFPIKGNTIKPFVNNDAILHYVLNELKDLWIDNNCELSTTEMKEHLPGIINRVQNEKKYLINVEKKYPKRKFKK